MKNSFRLPRRRGFGLIDVSLGIIAGIGLLVGAVILFQQVSTNNAVAEVTRNAATISSEIRSAARNLPNFTSLPQTTPATTPASINLGAFGLETGILTNPDVMAVPAASTFELRFSNMTARACQRAAIVPGNLGSNVNSANCTGTTLTVVYAR